MPIYEYVCTSCGMRHEFIHAIHAAAPDACPACAGRLRKALSAPAIHFKGSGWAKMDARAGARSGASKPSDGEPPEARPTAPGERQSEAASSAAPSATASPSPQVQVNPKKGSAPGSGKAG